MERFVIGFDGGGTKTEAVIMNLQAEELGRGIGGPGNIATLTPRDWQRSMDDAAREAMAKASLFEDTPMSAVCCAVAGFTAVHPRADLESWLTKRFRTRVSVVPDFVGAWWAAFEGKAGVLVIAGTGSVVYGRDTEGRESRCDGRGFLLGDRGSGFDIGRRALQHLVFRLETQTDLDNGCQTLLDFMGCSNIDEVIEWTYRPFQPSRIASLAEVVGFIAIEQQLWAIDLLKEAGRALRRSMETVFQDLDLSRKSPVALAGGLWRCSDQLERTFLTASNEEPLVNVHFTDHDPAWGAAYCALRLAVT